MSTEQSDIDNHWKVYGLTVVICSRSLRVTAPSMRYYDYHYPTEGDQLAYDRVMKRYRIAYNSYSVCPLIIRGSILGIIPVALFTN